MSAYVYIRSEPGLYTVGFYDAAGKWQAESDHSSKDQAAARVAWLNGAAPDLLAALKAALTRFDEIDLASPAGLQVKAALARAEGIEP